MGGLFLFDARLWPRIHLIAWVLCMVKKQNEQYAQINGCR
jgi:hypothetical protein